MDCEPIITEVNLRGKRFIPRPRYAGKKRDKNVIAHSDYDVPKWIMKGMYADESCRQISRAGCIFYTYDSLTGEYQFCFGRDTKSKELTDFGGQRNRGENLAACAGREATEESLGVFGQIFPEFVLNFSALYNKGMYISFIRVSGRPDDIHRATTYSFNEMHKELVERTGRPLEVCSIHWLSLEELKESLGDSPKPGYNIYNKVRRFLCSGFQIYNEHRSFFNLYQPSHPFTNPLSLSS